MLAEQRPGLGGDQAPAFNLQETKSLYLLNNAVEAEGLGYLMLGYHVSRDEFESGLSGAIAQNPGVVAGFLDNPDETNRYRTALVAGLVLPLNPSIQRVYKPAVQDGVKLGVTSYHNDWILCPDAEGYMKKALKSNALVLVNGAILVKTVGKFTGLCVKSFETEGGTFLEGNWYSPVDNESREAIRQGFDRGDARIDLTEGTWVLLRSVYDDKGGQEVLERSKQKAENMPRHLPLLIHGVPRRKFRVANFEAMK